VTISIRCECGKALKAREESRGKKVRCPACGASVPVPAETEESPKKPKGRKKAGSAYVWMPPATGVPSFVVLTRDAVCLARWVKTSNMEYAIEKLKDGEPAEDLMGMGDTVVPLGEVTQVQVNSTLRQVFITRLEQGLQLKTESASFTDDALYGFYETLREFLGPGWVENKVQQSRLQAAWKPLVGMLISGLIVPAIIIGSIANRGDVPWQGWCFIVFLALIFVCALAMFILNLKSPPLLTNLSRQG
jgi:hypothetical protein